MCSYERFFDTASFPHPLLFERKKPVWEVLGKLKSYLDRYPLGSIEGKVHSRAVLENPHLIALGSETIVEPFAYVQGPCILGKGCRIGQGSHIRPYVVLGDGSVVGHGSEVKGSIFLNGAKAPHFNYVGDSVLGNSVNLGAGVICANLRLDEKAVFAEIDGIRFATNQRKLGAMIGDFSSIGCHSVINPGTVLNKGTRIRPLSSVCGKGDRVV